MSAPVEGQSRRRGGRPHVRFAALPARLGALLPAARPVDRGGGRFALLLLREGPLLPRLRQPHCPRLAAAVVGVPQLHLLLAEVAAHAVAAPVPHPPALDHVRHDEGAPAPDVALCLGRRQASDPLGLSAGANFKAAGNPRRVVVEPRPGRQVGKQLRNSVLLGPCCRPPRAPTRAGSGGAQGRSGHPHCHRQGRSGGSPRQPPVHIERYPDAPLLAPGGRHKSNTQMRAWKFEGIQELPEERRDKLRRGASPTSLTSKARWTSRTSRAISPPCATAKLSAAGCAYRWLMKADVGTVHEGARRRASKSLRVGTGTSDEGWGWRCARKAAAVLPCSRAVQPEATRRFRPTRDASDAAGGQGTGCARKPPPSTRRVMGRAWRPALRARARFSSSP